MSDVLFSSMPQTDAECETVFNQMLAEIQRLNEQMCQDQADIDRLRFESAAFKAESQKLKMEGERLNRDIRERLSSLHASLDRLAGAG